MGPSPSTMPGAARPPQALPLPATLTAAKRIRAEAQTREWRKRGMCGGLAQEAVATMEKRQILLAGDDEIYSGSDDGDCLTTLDAQSVCA